MNIQQLRHALKVKWLLYYRQNRPWLTKLRIWGTYEGIRRPSSSFILAALANSEPQLLQMLPFIVSLSSNPDQIVIALGLNFNPEEELQSLTAAASMVEISTNSNGLPLGSSVDRNHVNGNGTMPKQALPRIRNEVKSPLVSQARNLPSWVDENCQGVGWNRHQPENSVGTFER